MALTAKNLTAKSLSVKASLDTHAYKTNTGYTNDTLYLKNCPKKTLKIYKSSLTTPSA